MNTDRLGPNEGAHRLTIRESFEDFDAALGARTRLPPGRLQEVLSMGKGALRHEAREVTGILERFAAAVVESWERPQATDDFLRSLDLKAVSRDHDWRRVFATVRRQGPSGLEYKRSAIVRYLQYLGFRKRLVEYVRMRRQGLTDTDAFDDVTRLPRRDSLPGPGSSPAGADEQFMRVPLGETLELRLVDGCQVDVMLGSHLFRLVGSRHPCLVDAKGEMAFLGAGRNMVGRHPESDVVVDPDFGHVSRAHLVIDWEPPERARIIDLSTRGTWLRRSVLARARSVPG